MKKTVLICLAGLLAATPLIAAKKNPNRLVLEGSTTVLPIAQRAAEEFMNAHPDADINVRGGGSGVGITSLIDGTCDIANSSRPIKDTELQKAAGKGITPKANVIAMDGIAVIVNPANPVNDLNKQQIAAIYTGAVSDWSKIGSGSGKIVVISRDSASGTYEAFGTLALNGKKVRADALAQASNQTIAAMVAKTPGAIGYVGMGYVTDQVKPVPVNGVKATKQTVLSGKYPFSRPLFMYTNGPAAGMAKEFLGYILSSEGQKMTEEEGFVSLK